MADTVVRARSSFLAGIADAVVGACSSFLSRMEIRVRGFFRGGWFSLLLTAVSALTSLVEELHAYFWVRVFGIGASAGRRERGPSIMSVRSTSCLGGVARG